MHRVAQQYARPVQIDCWLGLLAYPQFFNIISLDSQLNPIHKNTHPFQGIITSYYDRLPMLDHFKRWHIVLGAE